MENASKALIIAGAILISILLISVGIIVMNSINKPIDQATAEADSQAVEMFNSRFTGYSGADQSAQAIKSLCTAVASSNGSDAEHKIKLYYKKNSAGASFVEQTAGQVQAAVSTKNKYDVDLGFSHEDAKAKVGATEYTGLTTKKGYLAVIEITEK